jgi:hypothetical protein
MNRSFGNAALLAAAIVCFTAAATALAAAPSTQPAAAWASLAPNQWPQLVLTNGAAFTGHSPMQGASSFLVTMPDGQVYLGTAKHLIKAAGGVDPIVPLEELDSALQQWKAYPRTKPAKVIAAKGLAESPNAENDHDWLLLKLTDPAAKLPATPLVPRATPVAVGETVYLIGVPYSDTASAQNVYKGKVTARPFGNYFTYEFSPPVHISGFSGAPIVDEHGLLVGHGVSRSKLKQQDGLEVEFGGEDATLAVLLWKHRADKFDGDVLRAQRLVLPVGWVEKASKSDTVVQYAARKNPSALMQLIPHAKFDFDDRVTLKEWSESERSSRERAVFLSGQAITPMIEVRVAGKIGYQYDVTGSQNGVQWQYRYIQYETEKCYCKLVFWVPVYKWAAAAPALDEVVAAMK